MKPVYKSCDIVISNIFTIITEVGDLLKNEGLTKESKQFSSEVFQCESHFDVIRLIQKYVTLD